MSKESYKIPPDLNEIFVKYVNEYEMHKKECNTGSYRVALQHSKRARKLKNKFWKKVWKLYPKTKDHDLRYCDEKREVTITD